MFTVSILIVGTIATALTDEASPFWVGVLLAIAIHA